MQTIAFSLADIAGLSAFNARQGAAEPEGIAELAESIATAGLQEPLTLRREARALRVLHGGRRLAALKLLWERGAIGEISVFEARLFEGDDQAAAQYSLASFLLREGLWPVDEFERVVAHAQAFGLDAAGLARQFGKSVHWARDRQRLDRLSPKVRAAWRRKQLTFEQARAFAVTEDAAAQEALLDEELAYDERAEALDTPPIFIRRRLIGGRVAATDRLARFVGKDDYLAAGGAIEEQLFAEVDVFEDGALLRRLADVKLFAVLRRIMKAEKWGFGWHALEPDFGDKRFVFADRRDYTAAEQERLDAIDDAIEDELDEAKIRRLEAERDEIERAALLRAVRVKERKTLGVRITIAHDGTLEIDRAVKLATQSARSPEIPLSRETEEGGERREPGGGEPPSPLAGEGKGEGEKETAPDDSPKAILDAAACQALEGACARHPDLALIFAVAALGCAWDVQGINLRGQSARANFEPKSPLLRSIADDSFQDALLKVLRARLGDAEFRLEDDACAVLVAFAELIGGLVNPAGAPNFDKTRLLLAAARRFGAIETPLAKALNYEAWFEAAGKEGALAAIAECGGDVKALKKLKAPEVKAAAAKLARDKGWLPKFLALESVSLEPSERSGGNSPERLGSGQPPDQVRGDGAKDDPRPLAQAMAEAIDADEEDETEPAIP